MFGRSGQMFPRRAYHDAIYEEEYGSESDEDCCRGRGLSAILCWFLSVVILIGLAASVVLTVFFILKSRSLLARTDGGGGEDLNFVFDHGNGFKVVPSTISTTLDPNFNSSSTSAKDSTGRGDDDNGHWMHTKSYVEATARAVTTVMTTTTSTEKLPPTTTRYTTRKYYSDTTGDYGYRTTPIPPTSESSSVFKFLFNTIKTFQGGEDGEDNEKDDEPSPPPPRRYNSESIEQPPIEEITDNNSDEDNQDPPHPAPPPTTTTTTPTRQFHSSEETTTTPQTMTTSSPILFTLPPSTSTVSQSSGSSSSSRRYNYPTRSPERTSFSSEETSASTYKHYDYRRPYGSPPRRTTAATSSEEPTTTAETTSSPSLESNSNEGYQRDESKRLTSILQDQIPPHHQDDFDSQEYTATTAVPPSTHQSEDRSQIIRKQPNNKWNKTSTSVTTPRTRNRYIEIRTHKSSKENESGSGERYKNSYSSRYSPAPSSGKVYIVTPEKPTTTSSTTDKDSDEVSHTGRKVVPSSSNSKNRPENDSEESNESTSKEVMDILVNSDNNQKTLITEQTENGRIITSAMLPPWFDPSPNSTDSLEMTNDTIKFTTERVGSPSNGDDASDIFNDKTKADLDALLDLFTPSGSKEDDKQSAGKTKTDNNNNNTNKKPKSETYISDSTNTQSKSTHLKKLEEELKPFFSSPSEPVKAPPVRPPPSLTRPNRPPPSSTGFHYGPSDGKTHVYGYYPNDEELDHGPSVDHVDIEIEDRSDNLQGTEQNQNRRNDSAELNDDDERADFSDGQSSVIDIAYDPKVDPEIVIEPDAGELNDDEQVDYDNVSELTANNEPLAAGSDAHSSQVYAPAPANMLNKLKRGGNKPNDGGGIRRPTKTDKKVTTTTTNSNQPVPEQIERPGKWSSREQVQLKIPPKDKTFSPSKRWSSKEMLTTAQDQSSSKLLITEPDEYSGEEMMPEEDAPIGETYYTDVISPNRNGTNAESTVEENGTPANRKIERKPIVEVDASIYDVKDEKFASSTTSKPRVRVYEVYSEPYRPSEPPEPPTERPADITSDELHNQTGFVPPQPINFHDNTYAIDNQRSSEYVSRDGWRPVLYGRGKEAKLRDPNPVPRPTTLTQKPSVAPQQFSSPARAPSFTAPQAVPITTPIHIPATTPTAANGGSSAAADEYDDEMASQETNNYYSDQPAQEERLVPNESKLPIKPSRPIPPMFLGPQPGRIRFPEPQQRPNLQPLPPSAPQQLPQQQPQNLRQPLMPHSISPDSQSPPRPQIQHQGVHQHPHPPQQQQQQQQQQLQPNQHNNMPQLQAQASQQNSIVERLKYTQRPVRPPIIMRRRPPYPFSPGNRKRVTKIKINGPPRNLPRGPPYPPSSPPVTPNSPEQFHSQQQQQQQQQSPQQNQLEKANQPQIRQRHDPPFQQPPPHHPHHHHHPGNMMMPHGAVHWPPDDMFLKRQQQQPPQQQQQAQQTPPQQQSHVINRRPSG